MRTQRSIKAWFRFAAVGLAVLGLGGCVAAPPIMPVAGGPTYLGAYCSAGFYQCPLPQPGPVGAPCSCPGLGAPSFGSIR